MQTQRYDFLMNYESTIAYKKKFIDAHQQYCNGVSQHIYINYNAPLLYFEDICPRLRFAHDLQIAKVFSCR